MKAHQRTVGKNDEWLTPKEILIPLGKFDLDPATCNKAWKSGYYIHDGNILIQEGWDQRGLILPWHGRVWLNPPFNRYERPKWMKKMAEHGNGIMLIPAALETKACKEYVHKWGSSSGVLFPDYRPHFLDADGNEAKANSGCTIMLVAYGEENLKALMRSDLGPVYSRTSPKIYFTS